MFFFIGWGLRNENNEVIKLNDIAILAKSLNHNKSLCLDKGYFKLFRSYHAYPNNLSCFGRYRPIFTNLGCFGRSLSIPTNLGCFGRSHMIWLRLICSGRTHAILINLSYLPSVHVCNMNHTFPRQEQVWQSPPAPKYFVK